MDAEQIAACLLSISTKKDIADLIKAKLNGKKEFTVIQPFEPNGRINIAQVQQYVMVSKLVAQLGGKYIVFIADVVSSMNHSFGRDKAKIEAASKYAIKALKASGVDGPHVQYIISDNFTIENFNLFTKFVEITTHLPASAVQNVLPPMGKKERETLTASQLIAPMLHLTELVEAGADFIVGSEERYNLLSLFTTINKEDPPVIIPIRQIMKLKGVKSNPPKPDPKNTVFFEDDDQTLGNKFNAAFCTDAITDNPVFEYINNIVIPRDGKFEFNGKTYEFGTEDFANDFPTLEKKTLKQALAALFVGYATPIRAALAEEDTKQFAEIAKEFTTAH